MRYYVLIIIVLFCSCRTRKVSTDISKSETKVKTEQSSEVSSKTERTEIDKSTNNTNVTDKSEIFETDSSTVTADSLVFEKGVLKKALGSVKYSKRTNTRKSNNIQSAGTIHANTTKKTIVVKDSSGIAKFDSTTKTKDKVKTTEVKSASWIWIPIALVVVIAGLIVWYLRKR